MSRQSGSEELQAGVWTRTLFVLQGPAPSAQMFSSRLFQVGSLDPFVPPRLRLDGVPTEDGVRVRPRRLVRVGRGDGSVALASALPPAARLRICSQPAHCRASRWV